MACFHPLSGFRAPGGRVTLRRAEGYTDLPVTIACGQCSGCRLERSRQWAVRIMHELGEVPAHRGSSFITLTYRDEDLPHTKRGEEGVCVCDHPVPGGLCVHDWQRFAKRLRKALGPFRYFHCGEYGDLYGRPHAHAILMGIDFVDDRESVTRSKRGGHAQFTSPTLEKLWPHGRHIIGSATFESAAYCARYIMKKQTGPNAAVYEGKRPPYITMSRRPGIGHNYIKKFGAEVYRDDAVIVNGKRARPPRYYDGQYELVDPEGLDQVKARRKEKAAEHAANNTPERLSVRERVLEGKLSTFKGREFHEEA